MQSSLPAAGHAQRRTLDSAATQATLARLHESGLRHVAGGALTDLLAASLGCMVESVRAAGGYVLLLEPDAAQQRLVAGTGDAAIIAMLARHRTDTSGSADGALTVVEDVAAAGLPDRDRRLLQAAGITTLHLTPLSGRRVGPLGIIGTFAMDDCPPSLAERTLASLIARQTADFIEAGRADRELRQQSATAAAALSASQACNRRKDQFLATLSHELRQPLAAVMSALEVQKRSIHEVRRARAGEIANEQLRQMLRLVDDLRNVALIGRGMIELRRERVDVRHVMQQAVDMTMAQFERKRQQLVVAVEPDPVWVAADPTRMKQVFSNLLQNATNYTPAGGEIRLTLVGREDRAEVSFRDNGVGIAPDALTRIFDLFERGSADRNSLGLGIGLAVVRQVVELHGGTVRAFSDGAGTGSEFVVTMPIAS